MYFRQLARLRTKERLIICLHFPPDFSPWGKTSDGCWERSWIFWVAPGGCPPPAGASRTSACTPHTLSCRPCDRAVLRNRIYFLPFRFRLLTSYGSVSDFWQVTVPFQTFDKLRFRFRLLTSYSSVSDFWQVTVPIPTFDKLRFRLLTSYSSGSGFGSVSRTKKTQFSKNLLEKILPFYIVSLFTRKKF